MTKHIVVQQASICEAPFFVALVDESTRKAYVRIEGVAFMFQALVASATRFRVIRTLIAKTEVTQGPELETALGFQPAGSAR